MWPLIHVYIVSRLAYWVLATPPKKKLYIKFHVSHISVVRHSILYACIDNTWSDCISSKYINIVQRNSCIDTDDSWNIKRDTSIYNMHTIYIMHIKYPYILYTKYPHVLHHRLHNSILTDMLTTIILAYMPNIKHLRHNIFK